MQKNKRPLPIVIRHDHYQNKANRSLDDFSCTSDCSVAFPGQDQEGVYWYTPDELRHAYPGMPVVPAETNTRTYSNDIANAAYTKQFATATSQDATGPTGATDCHVAAGRTACTLKEDNSTNVHRIYWTSSLNGSTAYSWSAIMKANTARNAYIKVELAGGTRYVNFGLVTRPLDDLQRGKTIISGDATAIIYDLGAGWYYCELRLTTGAGDTGTTTISIGSIKDAHSYLGDGSSGIFIYEIQQRTQEGVAAIIHTEASSASSAAIQVCETSCEALKPLGYHACGTDEEDDPIEVDGDIYFKQWHGLSGVHNLYDQWTVNSISKDPDYRFRAYEASLSGWQSWEWGKDLVYVPNGTAPSVNDGSPFLGVYDQGVQFYNGGYFEGEDSSVGDIGDTDFIFTIAFMPGQGAMEIMRKDDGAGGKGWRLWYDGSSIQFRGYDGFLSTVTGSLAIESETINWFQLFSDGDQGILGSLSNSHKLKFGAGFTGKLYYWSIHQRTSWFNTTTDWPQLQALHDDLQSRLWGYRPSVAADRTPLSMSRGSAGMLDKVVGGKIELYRAGEYVPRQVHRIDSDDNHIYGGLVEDSSTNMLTYSRDITQWSKVDAGDSFSANQLLSPTRTLEVDGLITDSTTGVHGIYKDASHSANTHSFSIFVFPGTRDIFYLDVPTLSNVYQYFDATNKIILSGDNVNATMKGPYLTSTGKTCYKIGITFQGAVGTHRVRACVAQSDGVLDTTGDGVSIAGYFWQGQLEQNDHVSSEIYTGSGTASRSADVIGMAGSGNLGGEDIPGVNVTCDVLLEHTATIENELYVFSITDGASPVDQLDLHVASAENGNLHSESRSLGGNDGDATVDIDMANNNRRSIIAKYGATSLDAYADDEGASDSTSSVPDDKDRLNIGSDVLRTNQLGGVISKFTVYGVS